MHVHTHIACVPPFKYVHPFTPRGQAVLKKNTTDGTCIMLCSHNGARFVSTILGIIPYNLCSTQLFTLLLARFALYWSKLLCFAWGPRSFLKLIEINRKNKGKDYFGSTGTGNFNCHMWKLSLFLWLLYSSSSNRHWMCQGQILFHHLTCCHTETDDKSQIRQIECVVGQQLECYFLFIRWNDGMAVRWVSRVFAVHIEPREGEQLGKETGCRVLQSIDYFSNGYSLVHLQATPAYPAVQLVLSLYPQSCSVSSRPMQSTLFIKTVSWRTSSAIMTLSQGSSFLTLAPSLQQTGMLVQSYGSFLPSAILSNWMEINSFDRVLLSEWCFNYC